MSAQRGKPLSTMMNDNDDAMPAEPDLRAMISIKPEEEKEDMSWKKMQNMYVHHPITATKYIQNNNNMI